MVDIAQTVHLKRFPPVYRAVVRYSGPLLTAPDPPDYCTSAIDIFSEEWGGDYPPLLKNTNDD